jgi:ribosome-associated protein
MSIDPVLDPRGASPAPAEATPAADATTAPAAASPDATPAADATTAADATPAPAETPAPTPAPRAGLPVRTTPPPEIDKAPLDLARRIVELAEDKKAADIILLEIAPLTTVADYLVLCSGGSERQLGAIADGVTEGLKAEGIRILSREGEPNSHWILLDAGAVVVHVFAPPEREFYALERLWADARTVLRVQ